MGKASERKAAWQLSFFILPVVVLIIFALPTRGIEHEIEGKIILLALIFIGFIVKSELDKRKSPSLTSFFNHVQSIMLAIMCMIVFFGLIFLFDYLFGKWFGEENIYGYLAYGLLTALACYLIIRRNPASVRYVPYIIYFPIMLSALVEDFDARLIPGIILTTIASALAYYTGKKKAESIDHRLQ